MALGDQTALDEVEVMRSEVAAMWRKKMMLVRHRQEAKSIRRAVQWKNESLLVQPLRVKTT